MPIPLMIYLVWVANEDQDFSYSSQQFSIKAAQIQISFLTVTLFFFSFGLIMRSNIVPIRFYLIQFD